MAEVLFARRPKIPENKTHILNFIFEFSGGDGKRGVRRFLQGSAPAID